MIKQFNFYKSYIDNIPSLSHAEASQHIKKLLDFMFRDCLYISISCLGKDYGSIKGADGKVVAFSPEQSTIKLNVDVDGFTEIDIPADAAKGVHIIEADLGDTKLESGRLRCHIYQKLDTSELVFSEAAVVTTITLFQLYKI